MPRETLRSPFAFPHAGRTRHAGVYSNLLSPTGTHTLLNVTGQGVVRRMRFILRTQSGMLTSSPNILFNVKYDGESSPSISVPLMSLVGYEKAATSLIANIVPSTDFFEITTPGNSLTNQDVAFDLTWPVPFTNSIHIYLSTTGTVTALVWTNVDYQDVLPSCWNRNLRWMATRTAGTCVAISSPAGTIGFSGADNSIVTGVGTNFTGYTGKFFDNVDGTSAEIEIISVTDATHCTVDPAHTAGLATSGLGYDLTTGTTVFTRTAESGWVASIFAGMAGGAGVTDFGYLEGNMRCRVDGETLVSWESTSVEDMFGGAFYWADNRTQNTSTGVTCYTAATTYVLTAYRHFRDDPIRYTSSLVMVMPHYSGTLTTVAFTTVFYKVVGV